MAFINRGGYMLSHATIGKVAQSRGIGMLKRIIPFIRKRHGNGDRLFGLYVNVHVPAARAGTVNAAGVVIGRVKADFFVTGTCPIESFLLRGSRLGDGTEQQSEGKRDFHGFIHI